MKVDMTEVHVILPNENNGTNIWYNLANIIFSHVKDEC